MDLLSYVDTYLSRLRATQLLDYVTKALANTHDSDITDSIRMFKDELTLFSKILQLRANIQKRMIDLSRYAEFRNNVVEVYSMKFKIRPKDRPRLRICRSYGVTSVCIATKDTTYWIGDQNIYTQFTTYLQLKKKITNDMKQYGELLGRANKSKYRWVRKLSRYLVRELKTYVKMFNNIVKGRNWYVYI